MQDDSSMPRLQRVSLEDPSAVFRAESWSRSGYTFQRCTMAGQVSLPSKLCVTATPKIQTLGKGQTVSSPPPGAVCKSEHQEVAGTSPPNPATASSSPAAPGRPPLAPAVATPGPTRCSLQLPAGGASAPLRARSPQTLAARPRFSARWAAPSRPRL